MLQFLAPLFEAFWHRVVHQQGVNQQQNYEKFYDSSVFSVLFEENEAESAHDVEES